MESKKEPIPEVKWRRANMTCPKSYPQDAVARTFYGTKSGIFKVKVIHRINAPKAQSLCLVLDGQKYLQDSFPAFFDGPLMSSHLSLIRRSSQVGTRIATLLFGIEVGCDDYGNRYYRERRAPQNRREKRWVLYRDEPEASLIPPAWHIWIHYLADSPLPESDNLPKPWLRPHQPGHHDSGTTAFSLPSSSSSVEGFGKPAAGTYNAWTPET